MEGSVAGVRIFPAVVQFNDAEPHVLHQMNLKVQNLSKFSKFVRFHSPNSKVKFIFVNVAGIHKKSLCWSFLKFMNMFLTKTGDILPMISFAQRL